MIRKTKPVLANSEVLNWRRSDFLKLITFFVPSSVFSLECKRDVSPFNDNFLKDRGRKVKVLLSGLVSASC